MPKRIIPPLLPANAHMRVIAPSCSAKTINAPILASAQRALEAIGFRISFSEHMFELNRFQSSSVDSRIVDLHTAFLDPTVDGILAVRGGFNENDLLDKIDWSTIAQHPKVFCGYSDNTILQNALLAQVGMVSFSGPNFATFGSLQGRSYTIRSFINAVQNGFGTPVQNKDTITVIHKGRAQGTVMGGNLCTFNLLQGSRYQPHLANAILFLEDDHISPLDPLEFYRNLQSLIHLPEFKLVQGIVFGKFAPASKLPPQEIAKIVTSKPELSKIPILANLNFGHTLPMFTFPIGGKAVINTAAKDPLTISL